MVEPVRENPITVEAEVEIINPLASAFPPLAPVMVRPVKLNWNPAISTAELRCISNIPGDSLRVVQAPKSTCTPSPIGSDSTGLAIQTSPTGSI